ncbi:biliverdin-producing heme oxygenase [Luteibacter sp. NPDC031894]|uniref:biliverdin-producing heme oxygenase n=1 Tax=Luteibacter sp. NPDC031894 TaxID=3390572 RepID=UPI003D0212F3
MDGARAVHSPAHIVLRESTRAAHEAAEASPLMVRLLSGDLDEGGYRRLLDLQQALFLEWENQRGSWLAGAVANAGWRYVSRAQCLATDIGNFGKAPGLVREPALAIDGEQAAWGELYVIEGSALGGRLIVKRLRERFPSLPHHFYAIGESDTGSWRRFQAVLDRELAGPDALQAAVDGALRMFARFQQTLKDDAAHG